MCFHLFFMDFHEGFIDFHGFAWISISFSWIFIDFHGFPCAFMGFHEGDKLSDKQPTHHQPMNLNCRATMARMTATHPMATTMAMVTMETITAANTTMATTNNCIPMATPTAMTRCNGDKTITATLGATSLYLQTLQTCTFATPSPS